MYRFDSSGASEGQTLIPGSDTELTAPLDIAFDASGRAYVIDLDADGRSFRLLRYLVDGSGTAAFESELISSRTYEWAPGGGRVRIQFFKEPADESGGQWLQLTDPYSGTIETYIITDTGATQLTLVESQDILGRVAVVEAEHGGGMPDAGEVGSRLATHSLGGGIGFPEQGVGLLKGEELRHHGVVFGIRYTRFSQNMVAVVVFLEGVTELGDSLVGRF